MTGFHSIEALERRTLLAAGQLDPSFGDAGVVTAPPAIAPVAVLPQADGKVLVAGETIATPGLNEPPYTQATYAAAIVRYNADGSLDTTFGGGDGFVASGVPGWDSFHVQRA